MSKQNTKNEAGSQNEKNKNQGQWQTLTLDNRQNDKQSGSSQAAANYQQLNKMEK